MSEQSDSGASEARRARKANRQSFGSVRKLASGRVQARYPDVKGRPMTAPITFATKQDALDYLAGVRADRMRGTYHDHRAGRAMRFERFAADWIANGGSRGKLAPKTAELYRGILAHQLEHFDGMPISTINPAEVRTWYSRRRKALADSARARAEAAAKRKGLDPAAVAVTRTGETRLRQSYALLKAIMATAAADGLIPENPCRIVGAGIADSPERPLMDPEVLAAIVGKMPQHYSTPIRLMFGAHLRLGELVALRRSDYDPATGALRVERQTVIVEGKAITTATKTGEARTVVLPPSIAAMVSGHLADTRGFGRDPLFGRSLTGDRSLTAVALSREAIQQAWAKAAKAMGHSQFHLHDVRHAGLTLAAQSGATTRELMQRAGHKTARASLIYQHAAEQRNVIIAERMDALTGGLFGGAYGTGMARSTPAGLETGTEGNSETAL